MNGRSSGGRNCARLPWKFALVTCLIIRLAWSWSDHELYADEGPPPIQYQAPERVARLDIPELTESSGLAASRMREDILWTHNDSGDRPRLFAIDTQGRLIESSDVSGATALDWEDMCSYVQDGKSYLLVGDTGDNRRSRKEYTLYRIPEARDRPEPLVVDQVVQFKFETGPCDCEAIAFDPTRREVILVDKGWNLACRVFVLRWPSPEAGVKTARHVATLQIAGITGMDISPDGHRAVVCTYGPGYEFTRKPHQTWKDAFRSDGRKIPLPARRQGESICYAADGVTLYLTSEHYPSPLFRVSADIARFTIDPRPEPAVGN